MTATFLPVGGQGLGYGHAARVLHGKPLEAADIDGSVHHTAAAADLAGVLADESADGGQGVVLADKPDGVGVSARFDEGDIAGDIHARGALRHAGDGLVERAFAASVFDMLHEVVAEAADALENHIRGLIADRAVRRKINAFGRLFDQVDGVEGRVAVENVVQKLFQLSQAYAAGHAFAAGLRVAHLQKRRCYIHGAKSRGACADTAFHVLVKLLDGGLRLVLGNDTQSAHKSSRF